jgi:hypothetical protein
LPGELRLIAVRDASERIIPKNGGLEGPPGKKLRKSSEADLLPQKET